MMEGVIDCPRCKGTGKIKRKVALTPTQQRMFDALLDAATVGVPSEKLFQISGSSTRSSFHALLTLANHKLRHMGLRIQGEGWSKQRRGTYFLTSINEEQQP